MEVQVAAAGRRSCNCFSIMIMLLLAMVMGLAAVRPGWCSEVTIYEGPKCNKGRAHNYLQCGCTDIKKLHAKGGYSFLYTGADAYLYTDTTCEGQPYAVLSDNATSCDSSKLLSFALPCT